MTDLPERKACVICQSSGHDSKEDHLFLMDEKPDLPRRYCCSRVEYHPDGQMYYEDVPSGEEYETVADDLDSILGVGTPLVVKETNEPEVEKRSEANRRQNINQLPTVATRGISQATYERYGCKMQLSEVDLSVEKIYYPVLTHEADKLWKIRTIEPKGFKLSEPVGKRKLEFIGQHLYTGQKTCIIHEGQDDAIASDEMTYGKFTNTQEILNLSVPNGANDKAFRDNQEFLRKFNELILCPDQDKAGGELVEKVVTLYPNILIMRITEKDANDMLRAGKEKEYFRAIMIAKTYSPPSIVVIEDHLDTLKTPVPMGLSYPWKSLDAITYGMVTPQIVSIGSGPGVGKSSVIRAIQQHIMFHHNLPIGVFSMEDSVEQMLRYIVGYMMNKRIHIPGSVYDTDEAYHHGERLKTYLRLFDNRFFKGEWELIEQVIRFMYSEGTSHFFIDPISALAAHLDSSQANTFINTIMIKMSRLIQEIPIYIMLVNHLNNPTSGPAHDCGGRVLPSQFTGSKGQWRYSTDMWGCERNSLAEIESDRHIMTIRNLKHRCDGGMMGKVTELRYNLDTGRQEEMHESTTPFVQQEVTGVPQIEDQTLDDILGGN